MKTCRECEVAKPLVEFNKNSSKVDGRQDRCRPCDNSRARGYYSKNKSRMIGQINDAQKRRSIAMKRWICEYLEAHPCSDCGESDIQVLEFDHQRDKLYNVSKMLGGDFNLAAVQAEVAKCEVVCANCHKRRTDSSNGNYRVKYLNGLL